LRELDEAVLIGPPLFVARRSSPSFRVKPRRCASAILASFFPAIRPWSIIRPAGLIGCTRSSDGYRIKARKRGVGATLLTRRGTDYTDKLPRIAEAMRLPDAACPTAVSPAVCDSTRAACASMHRLAPMRRRINDPAIAPALSGFRHLRLQKTAPCARALPCAASPREGVLRLGGNNVRSSNI
jgi:hypothetical protein